MDDSVLLSIGWTGHEGPQTLWIGLQSTFAFVQALEAHHAAQAPS